MKKTIAILLVLVIGMAGVFAADALATPPESAKINITTTVSEFAYFGLTPPSINSVATTSGAAFLDDENIVDTILYEDVDLTDFAVAMSLAKLWGINNSSNDIDLTISTPGFIGDDGTTIIPLTLSIEEATIGAASGTTLGVINSADSANLITAVATDTTQVFTAIAQDYEATITIQVATT